MASHRGEEVIALDYSLHGKRGRASDRMADVGMPVLEEAAPRRERCDDLLAHEHGPDRLIAAAQPLGDRHQVRRDALLLDGVQRARAPHAAHDFVGDQEDAVPVADVANAAEITGHRRQCT